MKVKTQIHEAVLDQVRKGLPATVRVDAFPDQVYRGLVSKVAVVPSSSWSGAVKTYDCEVNIEGQVAGLKPGMTAVVDIHVDRVPDVLTVPVQAVVQADRENWVYISGGGSSAERRIVKVGRSNDKFVHIRDGLASGDRVILNPMDIFDEEEQGAKAIAPDAGTPEMPDEKSVANEKKSPKTQFVKRKPGTQSGGRKQRKPKKKPMPGQ